MTRAATRVDRRIIIFTSLLSRSSGVNTHKSMGDAESRVSVLTLDSDSVATLLVRDR
jgi:hypothetical protein